MEQSLLEAEELFNSSDFYNSFRIFQNLSLDESKSNIERADALNMMGVIISGVAPDLGNEQQTPLFFFEKALLFNPLCLGALMNIIFHFGESDSAMHQNKESFSKACLVVKEHFFENLTEAEKQEINKKLLIYKRQ